MKRTSEEFGVLIATLMGIAILVCGLLIAAQSPSFAPGYLVGVMFMYPLFLAFLSYML